LDDLLDIDYSVGNTNACIEIEKCIQRGAKIEAGNHFAIRNARKEKNVSALQTLINFYNSDPELKDEYKRFRNIAKSQGSSVFHQLVDIK
jgi:hypothetical protein